jgi:apolipoprotein N-acyltransferase
VQVQTPMLAEAVAAGTIRARSGRSVYGRVGDVFGAGCVLVVVGALVRARRGPIRPGAARSEG